MVRRSLSRVVCLALSGLAGSVLATREAAAQNNPPLQEMQNPPASSDASLLPPWLRNMAPQTQPSAPRADPSSASAEAPAAAPPAASTPGPSASAPSTPAAPGAPAPPPLDMTPQVQWAAKWQPATVAKIQALDKVNAQATNLTVKVGQAATFESMTISVKACVVRPADQPADAAAYLEVTDNHPDAPGFSGWMLANEPAVSMMQSPIYDLRVTGCT
jgi:hypothetical protein